MFLTFKDLDKIKDEMNHIFDSNNYFGTPSFPLTNVYEDDNSIHILGELPGVKKDDLNISLQENILKISGKRIGNFENLSLLKKELIYGDFSKSISISSKIDSDRIEATLENGLLKVTLPKREEVKPKQIEIF